MNKFYKIKKYNRNSKYKRHTGKKVNETQRYRPTNHHWRKGSKVAKKLKNKYRRYVTKSSITNSVIKPPKWNLYHFSKEF